MPVDIKFGKDEVKLTSDQLEEELAKSKSYINRNKRRHVFLTPPEQLKDLLLGIHVYRTTLPDVFDEDQTPRTVKVGAVIEFENMTVDEKAKLEEERSRKAKQRQDEARRARKHQQHEQQQDRSNNSEQVQQSGAAAPADPQPTVLQQIRLIHNTKGKFKSNLNKQDLLTMIQDSQSRLTRSRTGVSFSDKLHARTLEETVTWALAHAKENAASLLMQLLQLEEQLNDFSKERKHALERFHALHRREPRGADEFAEFYVDNVLPAGSGEANSFTSPMSSPPVSPRGHKQSASSRTSLQAASNSSHIHSHSHPNGSGGSPSLQHNHNHAISTLALTKRLDQLKESGTDAFDRAVSAPQSPAPTSKPSIMPGGLSGRRRYSIKSNDSGQHFSPAMLMGAQELRSSDSPGADASICRGEMVRASQSHRAGISANGNNGLNEAAPPDYQSPTAAASSSAAAIAAASRAKHDRAQQRRKTFEEQQRTGENGKSSKGSTYRQRRSQNQEGGALFNPNSQPTVYSNAVSGQAKEGQQNDATRKAIEASDKQTKAFKLALEETMEEFRRRDERLNAKCDRVSQGEERFIRGAKRLCSRLSNFDVSVAREAQHLQQTVDDKAFVWPEVMESMMANMKIDNHYFMRDLRVMELRVCAVRSFKQLERLYEARWLTELLPKVRELHRRAPGGNLPLAALLFVSTTVHVLMHGWALDEYTFYSILEGAVVQRDDHSKSAVHRMVSCVRDVVGVSPEQFLRYLASRDIPASPELTAQIRANRKKRRAAKLGRVTNRSSSLRPITEDGPGVQDMSLSEIANQWQETNLDSPTSLSRFRESIGESDGASEYGDDLDRDSRPSSRA